MCLFEKRTVEEIISICKLEPSTKNIYVEGISDKLVIDNFLKKQKIPNIDKTESDSSGIANVLADVPDKTVQKQSVRRHVE